MGSSVLLACALLGIARAQLPANYISQTGAQKLQTVWNLILAGQYTSNPLPRSVVDDSPLFNGTFLQGAFDQSIEEMPAGRLKTVGTNGITAQAELIMYPNSSYTGIFKPSSSNMGIMRLSSNTAANLVSYFAMKIFVDGNYSQNLHMIHDIIGWGVPSVDYFEWSFQTAVPSPLPADYASGRYSAVLDTSFNDCIAALPGGPLHRPANIWALGNTEQAQIDNKGVLAASPVAPFILQITPNPAVRPVTIVLATDDWRVKVTNAIPANTKLYSVQAKMSPCAQFDTVGEIWTRSAFVASSYPDKTMRFGQPYIQWDYSVAAPGTYCSIDPKALTTWPTAEATEMEDQAQGFNPPDIAYGNSPSAVTGNGSAAGVSG